MPNITLPISDLEQSVERPVVFDVMRTLLQIIQISSKTPIRFYGDEAKAAQKNSTFAAESGDNRWAFDDKIEIEVDEDVDPHSLSTSHPKRKDREHIFSDKALGVFIKPAYVNVKVTVRVKYRARDRNAANRWRNDMMAKAAMMRDVNLHRVVYKYHIPEKFLDLIQEIHRLRELTAGYGDDVANYFVNHLTEAASVVTNANGGKGAWAVTEPKARILGTMEFGAVPSKPEKGDADAYLTNFDYSFEYEKPTECVMVYPRVIHQSILDDRFLPADTPPSVEDARLRYSQTGLAMRHFEAEYALLGHEGNKGLSIPDFDHDFMPAQMVPSTVRVFTGLSTISPEERRYLLSLDSLGDFALDQSILDYFKEVEYGYLGTSFQSFFELNHYENERLQASGSLRVTSDLRVEATRDLSLRFTNRVRLALYADWALVHDSAFRRLKPHRLAAKKIIMAVNAAISVYGGAKDIGYNRLPEDWIRKLDYVYDSNFLPVESEALYSDRPYKGNPHIKKTNLVQTLFVQVNRLSDLPLDR